MHNAFLCSTLSTIASGTVWRPITVVSIEGFVLEVLEILAKTLKSFIRTVVGDQILQSGVYIGDRKREVNELWLEYGKL